MRFGATVLYVNDVPAAIDFYRRAFGLALRFHGGRPAGVEIGFLTDDVPDAFAKLIAAGAVPIAAARRMPWGFEVAYASAPDGTILGLSEPPLR
jgi:predicted enzyme related to lactoylglutathione lyase